MTRSTRGLVAAAAAAGALLCGAPGDAQAADPAVLCSDQTGDAIRLDMQVRAGDTGQLEDAFGYYAVPSGPPKGIVAFAHGHSNSAWKWRENLTTQAEQLGVIAVAMDYRRQTFPGGDITKDSFGWRVREGAEDSIAAAQLFDRQCLSALYGLDHGLPIVMYGVSLGGNTSGLAVASRPRRSNGTPLFDYWFDIEGVTNVIETYLEGRAIAGPPLNNKTGQTAVAEIHEEMGGPIEQRLGVYLRHAVVLRADDIKASGIKGVVMVHGIDDGTVLYDQSPEMFLRLVGERIPTDFFSVGRHGDAPKGSTLEDSLSVSKLIPGYSSPFTGHGGENDPRHPVVGLGFDRLAALFAGERPTCFRKFIVDGRTVLPDPASFKLPRCAG